MKKIDAPFTDEQVENLNAFQENMLAHPFTCDGSGCEQDVSAILKATNEGWVCPCGKYKQSWAHAFMAIREEGFDINKQANIIGLSSQMFRSSE